MSTAFQKTSRIPSRFPASCSPARAHWHQVAGLLKQMGVLTRIDGFALARYCRLWVRWRKAEAFLEQHGDVFPLKDDQGRVKCLQQFPQVSIANLGLQLTRLEQEFGMTPSARPRVHIEYVPEPAPNSKSRFFRPG